MSDTPPPPTSTLQDPQTDADRIRLKRLAKLQAQQQARPPSAGPSTPATPPPPPKPIPKPTPASKIVTPVPAPTPPPAKKPAGPVPLDVDAWVHETYGAVLGVTLEREDAEKSGYERVWLKPLADELLSEGATHPLRLREDLADRLLIARLELDPESMADDLDFLPVLASLPTTSVFSFLVSAWKRAAAAQSALSKRKHPPLDAQRAGGALSALRELLVSYAGLALQDPLMFPAPAGADPATLGAPELVPPLLALSALAGPLGAAPQDALLAPAEVGPFLADLSARFLPAGELPGVLGPVFTALLGVPALRDPGGLVAPDAAWRRVLAALDALLAVRGAPDVLTGLPAWCPDVSAGAFEHAALLGPLLRLGTFAPEWPALAQAYFGSPDARTRADVDASFASLRGTLKSLQNGLFGVVNTLVRAGAASRARVLAFFGAVVRLNRRRAGMQVEPSSVASDSFMLNALVLLLRLAEPFMDSAYSKLGRVDAHYFARSTLIDLGDETRVCATQDEARAWEAKVREEEAGAPPPNFVSDVFWLAGAVLHLGLLQTGARLDADARHHEDLRAHVAQIEGDDSWRAAPWRARTEAALAAAKKQRAELGAAQLAARAALEDGEVAFRALGFVNFVSTWILRLVDPAGAHPAPSVALPLPKDAPWAFRALPEYMFDDVVGTLRFYSRWAPQALALAGKGEVVVFALAFLTSTQYVTNPFLKSRLIEILAAGAGTNYRRNEEGRDRGPLAAPLLENPVAQKHMMSALMHFYIEVEQTGASSQFYDKFSSRTLMAGLFKLIWNSPVHKEALKIEAQKGDRFVKFVNLMIGDVTYLMDESLSDMSQIHAIQTEMADTERWAAAPAEHKREREKALRQLERMASGYCELARATVALLRIFTADARAPFMLPEIAPRLAAMLDYNLDALVGPRCADLKVADPAKYSFDPRALLKDFVAIFLNLAPEDAFVRAVAQDGRSYRAELFARAGDVCTRRGLKSPAEVDALAAFTRAVEAMKATIEAEEDLGDVPDEFTDPLLATLMRDPVILPSSRAVVDRATIRGYLLSETRDPFNRQPLTIDMVVPDVELKARIDAWLEERRAAKMDTT